MINIFDNDIKSLLGALEGENKHVYAYDESKALATTKHSELVLLKDCAFELGGSDMPCTGATVVSDAYPVCNQTIVYGKELCDIKKDCNYAKIVIIGLNESPDGEQAIFDLTKDLEYAKYSSNVSGFMMRASTMLRREQVRVSKQALLQGLTFEKLGATTIKNYLGNPIVKAVTVIFVADTSVDFSKIQHFSTHTSEILKAFNHILDNVLVDCAHCNLKEICDEVEGMRDMHLKLVK